MTDQSEWWCARCPTSRSTDTALAEYAAAVNPANTGSTSAQLRQTQTALAASQADLTQACAERAWLLAEATDDLRSRFFALQGRTPRPTRHLDRVKADLVHVSGQLTNALECFDKLQTAAGRKYQALEAERDLARAELASALAELDRWRSGAQPNTEGAPA